MISIPLRLRAWQLHRSDGTTFQVDADPGGATIAPEAFVAATAILETPDGVEAVRQTDHLAGVTGTVLEFPGELSIELVPPRFRTDR